MRSLLRHMDLVLFKTYADLRSEANRFYISYLWWIIEPVLEMCVYYIVFGYLLKRGTADYIPLLLIGLTSWNWMASGAKHGANSIINSKGLIEQVYLPKSIFPLIVVFTDTFKFLIVFTVLLLFLFLYGFTPEIHYVALPLVLAVQFLFVVSLAFFLAAITPFFPDLNFLITTIIRLGFFLSGIFYDGKSLKTATSKMLFYMNPMANIIDSYRFIMMYHEWPLFRNLGFVSLGSLVLFAGSLAFINRHDRAYPRILS